MILLKTKTFIDIWESDGIAPFNSSFVGTEILNYSEKTPILAIGYYSGEQANKNISLLMIQKIYQVPGFKNDINLKFKFIKKLEILSDDFETEVSKFSSKLVINVADDRVNKILKKFGYKISPPEEKKEMIQSPVFYKEKYLNPDFYSPGNWVEFEKLTAKLFNILGFQVEVQGHRQLKERVADLYCYSPQIIKENRICIIIDCKNQDNYFINAADERAMKEYILNKKAIIAQEGILPENLLFLFVALSFAKDSYIKVQEIAKSTNSFGALLSRDNLLFLVEKRLRMGYKFYLEFFQKLFKNQEITIALINYVYKIEDEFIS